MDTTRIVPEGSFQAKALDLVNWGESSNGNGQIGLTFTITEEGEFKGRRLPWFGVIPTEIATENDETTLRITVESLEAAGLPREDIDPESDRQPKLGSQECVIVVKHKTLQTYEDGVLVDKLDEEGNVQVIAEIAFVNSLNAARFKTKLSTDKRSAMKSVLKGRFAGSSIPVGSDGKPSF